MQNQILIVWFEFKRTSRQNVSVGVVQRVPGTA